MGSVSALQGDQSEFSQRVGGRLAAGEGLSSAQLPLTLRAGLLRCTEATQDLFKEQI